ncbi:hypothetical protein JW905_02745 [bacterium]|nr:hypothetical protein [candidate division CSSED10-310 bacterium]
MIIGAQFEGDDNLVLMELQSRWYGNSLGMIVAHATDHYRYAQRLLGMVSETGQKLAALRGFDHRPLQYFHDMLAAAFRLHLKRSGQTPADEDLEYTWGRFLAMRLDSLYEEYEVVRAVADAICYPNPDERGMAAEEILYNAAQNELERLRPNQSF